MHFLLLLYISYDFLRVYSLLYNQICKPNDTQEEMARRKRSKQLPTQTSTSFTLTANEPVKLKGLNEDQVEYVTEDIDCPPQFSEFLSIFSHFTSPSTESSPEHDLPTVSEHTSSLDSQELEPELSRKKLKKLCRLPLPILKHLSPRPDLIEYEDVTAPEPLFLAHIKSIPTSVAVPGHWSQKRKFLAGKRGFVKPPYELPSYLKATGITEQRNSLKQREESMSLSARAREKVNPRMGKIMLDYETMYNAFFKFQTKPQLSAFGDVYFEGKEFESRLRDRKAGFLSDELKEALGMAPLAPPPYLYNMQRFGPPPSYPYLQIPGLSAPIPEGCQWGFHPGGWGKPPVDAQNRPLYGDVFGLGILGMNSLAVENDVDKSHWGVVMPEDEFEIPPPPPPSQPSSTVELQDIVDDAIENMPTVVEKSEMQSATEPKPISYFSTSNPTASTISPLLKQNLPLLLPTSSHKELFQRLDENVKGGSTSKVYEMPAKNEIVVKTETVEKVAVSKEKKKEFKF